LEILKDSQVIRTVDQWHALAPPKRPDQWVDGRSALECARAWCRDGRPAVPAELADLLASHRDTAGAVIRSVWPEQKVPFDNFPGEPRNADIVAIADHPAGLIAINIEAKADEPFDAPVHEVLRDLVEKIAADERTNGVARIQQLAVSLLPSPAPNTSQLGDLRYQLLTGLAGAIAFAIGQKARRALFLVHEFITDRTDDAKHDANRRDLEAFMARLTAGRTRSLEPGRLVGPLAIPGGPLFTTTPSLYVGKAVRNVRHASS
jgi:hypothetical protein